MIGNADNVPGFRERLATLVGHGDPFAWAKRVGIPSSTFDRIWNLGTTPKAPHLIRISEACGVSVDWLLTGRAAATAPPDDLMTIPWLRPPGAGAPVGRLALHRDWLRRAGCADAAAVAMAVADGDGMAPTICEGDLLLVDRGAAEFRDDGLYLLALEGSFCVRRVQRLVSGALAVSADNPAYARETLAAGEAAALACLGRVRWSGRTR